jgi:GNAT superfamily N-acetyltransferase
MIIRRAQAKDLQKILELNQKLFTYEIRYGDTYNQNWTYSEKGKSYFANRLKNGILLIAEENKEIVGYLCAYTSPYSFRSINPITELENMFVLEEYRNQKIGSQLIERLIKEAKLVGSKRLKVGVLFKNSKAINFYLKQGFVKHEIILEKILL